ncbi:hypothetical protein JCM4020_18410 [Streptomyces coelicolor]|nr:hypothetical protein JCM4020_18410 [Streptomyces coelicolor]
MQGGDRGAAAVGELADRELLDLLWNLRHPSNPTDPIARADRSGPLTGAPRADHAKQSLRNERTG